MSAHAVTAEHRPTTIVQAPASDPPPPVSRPLRAGVTTGATVALAGILCFATFLAGGGLRLAPMTTLELVLTLASGATVATAIVLAPTGTRLRGVWSIALLLAFAALTGLSVAWSVAPDASWQDAGRMLAYSSVFAAAVALAWIAPGGWRALLGAIVLAAAVVCGYALLTKIFPDRLDAGDINARLQEPYGYWNAIGLTAAMGAIGCLWLGARRAGHAVLSALAYPAMGLMILTLMIAYSRGALAALAIGAAAWMCLVPLRLRGARVLIVGILGAAPVVAWDFSAHALSSDGVALAARTDAGHRLGVLIAAMVIVLMLVGVAIGFFGDRRAPSAGARRAVGIALAGLLVLAVVAVAGALSMSSRGLTGTISHDLSSLTDPNAPVPKNTPGRLTAIGSVRARYWNEALEIFKAHPALGAGAAGYETARLRYRTQPLDVKQAHGYVVQTLADLGIVGLAIALALLVAWIAAAGRSTHPFNRRWSVERRVGGHFKLGWRHVPLTYTPERIAMLTMLCIVVVFGVHSFADWTWYVPGDALVALLCAGWLAGRGSPAAGNPMAPAGTPASALPGPADASAWAPAGTPTSALLGPADASAWAPADKPASALLGPADASAWAPAVAPNSSPDGDALRPSATRTAAPRLHLPTAADLGPIRIAVAVAVVAGTLLAVWTEWQPQRSVDASEQALVLLKRNPVAARAAAQAGVDRDPLSAQALFTLSAVEHATGQSTPARATLQKAVRLQPSNPQTWLTLGQYDLTADPHAAVAELRAAVYLDPESVAIQNVYVQALRASGTATRTSGAASATGIATPPIGKPSATAAPARASNALPLTGRASTHPQKRLRRPRASSTRRAPGRPPAPATATSSKPKSPSRTASAPRV